MFCRRFLSVVPAFAFFFTHGVALAHASSSPNPTEHGFVVAGRRFSYFVEPFSGEVQAMGRNNYGQLGLGNTVDQDRPQPIVFDGGAAAVVMGAAAGAFHGLFVTLDGRAYATGWNKHGQFGLAAFATKAQTNKPVQVTTEVKAVAAGYGHSLFLMTSGRVRTCGLNTAGQLGDGTTTSSNSMIEIDIPGTLRPIARIAAGYDFSYFLKDTGEVYAVGQNLGGQLGDGTRVTQLTPVQVLIARGGGFLTGVAGMSAGESHGLFVKEDGVIYGTGANSFSQLASNTDGPWAKAAVKTMFEAENRVFVGTDSTCAAKSGGELSCVGSNFDGQLGLGNATIVTSPTIVPGAYAYDMDIGDSHSLFIDSTYSSVFVSGTNANGELGDGSKLAKKAFNKLTGLSFTGTTTITTTTTISTTTPPPTPATTPAPAPDVTRAPSASNSGLVTAILGVIGLAAVAACVFLVVQHVNKPKPTEAEEPQDVGDLELVRAGMSNA